MSVIVPARNEERAIERTVRALLAQSWRELEVIVVDDRSTDATGAILSRLRDENPGLQVIQAEEPPPGWLGKNSALHQGSLRATGDLLLFLDADVLYAPHTVEAAVAGLESSGATMLTLLPRFEMHGFWEHVLMPHLVFSVCAFLPVAWGNRSRSPVLAIGGGTGNLVRRQEYLAAGGHVALSGAVVDDVGLARLMRRHGHRTVAVRAEDLVSVRMYDGFRETVHGFTKNMFPVLNRSYAAATVVALLMVVGHLLPFALAAAGEPLAMAIVAVIVATRLVIFSSFGYRIDNALLAHPLMIGGWLYILARSVWYTGIRRQLHWRGRTYDAHKTRTD